MKKKYALIVAILLIMGGGYYWYNENHKMISQTKYIAEAAKKGALTKTITASGNVIVDQQATVDPTISGTVSDLNIKVGDEVKKGQFLFNIVNNDLDVSNANASTSYLQAQNTVDSAKLSVKEAKAEYDAAKDDDNKTSKQKIVIKAKIGIAENSLALAEKQLYASQISYRNVMENSGKRKVTAPISGTVNEINVKNGDDLGKSSSSTTSASSPIIIGDLDTLKASVSVNEVDIPNISLGQKVSLEFDAIDSLTATGEVEKIDSLGVESSGVVTYTVTIKFDSLDSRILPKMSVTASIISESKSDVFVVPITAIQKQGKDAYVQILNSGGVPEKRMVQLGISNDVSTEIVSGLNEGDNVIIQTIETSSATATSSLSSDNSKSSGAGGAAGILSGGGGPPSGGGPPQ